MYHNTYFKNNYDDILQKSPILKKDRSES